MFLTWTLLFLLDVVVVDGRYKSKSLLSSGDWSPIQSDLHIVAVLISNSCCCCINHSSNRCPSFRRRTRVLSWRRGSDPVEAPRYSEWYQEKVMRYKQQDVDEGLVNNSCFKIWKRLSKYKWQHIFCLLKHRFGERQVNNIKLIGSIHKPNIKC